ncbi:TIGR04282 family arsenosugar biosynthesis glycosyltransferase [Calothrix sp. 336/3]|uniref:TIGR04282 family arsenosugar biosynthesis glycosyltransferase n=1 Tax=Calothrix sp. 336/3 TaxID=1337936 RepID=UPI0004E2ACC0|nr:TIGR04282 family arsenosugar biosynthesis glycosyltransferase [Calothrix sp. 336/3]AKG23655.1 hypothetical protein IJ00_22310 [Calothrix sp. 336/3]
MLYSEKIFPKHLVIFTRYPEPGKTKTRMISALGAEGAAALQREMTEYTLSQGRELRKSGDVSLEIRFVGGNQELMQTWLGDDLLYSPQGEGDLGEKMWRSLWQSFHHGATQVIIIGTDCPELDSSLLHTAFSQQNPEWDLLLGAALDGGYYLIGLHKPIPELFINIDWGTSQVLAQTVAIAKQQNLQIHYLPTLRDIDRPEDLAIWRKQRNFHR